MQGFRDTGIQGLRDAGIQGFRERHRTADNGRDTGMQERQFNDGQHQITADNDGQRYRTMLFLSTVHLPYPA